MSKKKFMYGIVFIVILLIVILVIAISLIDSIAKSGVEKGATYALGVQATLNKVHIGLLDGQIDMYGLRIYNPDGFTSPYLMDMSKLDLVVQPSSLFSDTIRARKFVLDGLDINIDQTLTGNNVSKILDNIKRLSSEEKQAPEKTAEGGKKIFVDTITVKNVVAHFNMDVKLASKNMTVKIPTIILENVSSEDSPVVIRQLIMKVIPAILLEVIKHSKGIAPDNILKELKGNLLDTQNLLKSSVKGASGILEGVIGDGHSSSKKIINKKTINKKTKANIEKKGKSVLKGLLSGSKKGTKGSQRDGKGTKNILKNNIKLNKKLK